MIDFNKLYYKLNINRGFNYMNILILTASPNKDGLTASCGEAARKDVESTGNTVDIVCLNDIGYRKMSGL